MIFPLKGPLSSVRGRVPKTGTRRSTRRSPDSGRSGSALCSGRSPGRSGTSHGLDSNPKTTGRLAAMTVFPNSVVKTQVLELQNCLFSALK